MKKLITLLLTVPLYYACNTSTDTQSNESRAVAKTASETKSENNLDLAKAFIAAFESGEVEKWRDICSEDFITYGPGIKSESTLEEYIESMVGFHKATDSTKLKTLTILAHTIEEGDNAGDYVFWWGSSSAYFIEAGKSVEVRLHTVYGFEDGKISWNADYWDTGDLQQQLSDKFPSKEKKEGDIV